MTITLKNALYVVGLLVLLIGAMLIGKSLGGPTPSEVQSEASQTAATQKQLTEALIAGCEQAGRSITKLGNVLANQLQSQVNQQDAFRRGGLYRKFFPYVGRAELRKALLKGRRKTLKEKHQIERALNPFAPSNCASKYR